MNRSLGSHLLSHLPFFCLVLGALAIFERATALLDREEFLAYGYEPAAFALFAARGTGIALCLFGAGWLIWGGGKLAARLAVSLSLLATTLMLWHRLYDPELPWNAVSQHISSIVTFLGAALVLACASRFGVVFVAAAGSPQRDLRKWQVSILDLLVVTSGAAVLLAVVRGHLPRDVSQWQLSEDEVLWIGLHVVSNLLILSTVVACFHERRAWWVKLLVSGAISAAVAAMHIVALSRTRELPLYPIDAALLARGIHHAVDYGWLVGGLGTLHLAGYRLCRTVPRPDSPAGELRLEPSAAG